MTTAGYYNSGKRLEEGKTYPFIVLNIVTLQDERAYFILEDPFKIRHLLPSWFYIYYGIQVGQTISCIVDKINCTGRVYLEPEHPHYTKGCVYDFQLLSIQKNEKRKKLKIIFKDLFGNEIEVDCLADLEAIIRELQYVECTIEYVRKGKPVLVIAKRFLEKLKMDRISINFNQEISG